MKIRRNVGKLDSLFRIGAGFSMLGYGIVRKSDLLILLGSKKIAEGTTGFCMLYHLLGITTEQDKIEFVTNKKEYDLTNLK